MSTVQPPFQKSARPREDGSVVGSRGMPSRPSVSPAAPPEHLEGGTEQKFPFPFLNFFQGTRSKEKL